MIGHELAVEKGEAAHLESSDKPGKRDLRRIGGAAEHAFAEEGAAQLDPIYSADKLSLGIPAFNRMGMAAGVERERGPLDVAVDPGLLAHRAAADYFGEGAVAVTVKIPERSRLASERDMVNPSRG